MSIPQLLPNEQGSGRNRRVIYLIISAIATFLLWAAYAPLDEVVRGTGRVVPITKTQTVQNLEGGIVEGIFVAEGSIVDDGQRIAKMSETQFLSTYRELEGQRFSLMLKVARLQAEAADNESFIPVPELADQAPEYAASEIELFRVRRTDLLSSLESLGAEASLKRREAEILRAMVKKDAVAEIDLIRAEQAAVAAEGKVSTVRNEFETKRAQEYSDTLIKLRQVEEQMRIREDQLARTDVRSPVHGIVNKVVATTIGGVVGPGDPLVEIIPLDHELRIEGRIDPRDIGFVYVGMPASIKLTAFDFSIYGMLTGEVIHVGADTLTDPTQPAGAPPYYEVFVKVDATTLEGPDGVVNIRPGMLAQLELKSGEKTVLAYLLKPLAKTTEAFSER
ncbi:HlyD family efflux transporter periplasmic adaptor subunit [Celeribacter neptunius]|uniref:Membrane fusion protein, adhesin transport system n=1 Tax=Celeribacter neptunius TaxID=588602 RepID=A0A1I3QE94_9RHOB|nr:HlyD family efflux transporter periplasmic adaptor subunit [Celeribacter neptunius]SFJ31681.1 membrane fusion protein, adhesin transport system [Celeribacter neptunius]